MNKKLLLKKYVLVTLAAIFISMVSFAQGQLVTVKLANASLKELFAVIEKQTPYRFSYRDVVVSESKSINIDKTNVTVNEILDAMLPSRNLEYSIVSSKMIVVSDRVAPAKEQGATITGTVRDASGSPVVGATIIIRGTTRGASTNLEGWFALQNVDKGNVVDVSCVGYKKSAVTINTATDYAVVLEDDSQFLDEIVVVGYGNQSKKDLTGAVASIKAKDIENIPVNDFGSAIAGRTAGVQVVSASGKPNAGFSIRVRGATSINAGNEPLYIIDGVPTTDTKSINPSEIESISILKDASSAAIYGSAGANGVVIITTKQGVMGEAKIEFNASYGVSLAPKKIDVLNVEQYDELLSDLGYPTYDKSLYNADIDWQEQMYRNAKMQNYQLSVSGGNDKSRYYVSGGYISQDGIISPSTFDRYNFKANLDFDVKKWFKVGANVGYSHIKDVDVSDGNSEQVILKAITTPSVVGKYNANGTFMTLPFLSSLENPLSGIEDYNKNYMAHKLTAYVYGEITFVEGVKLKSSLGFDFGATRNKEFLDPNMSAWGQNQKGQASYNSGFSNMWINENLLSYTKTIDKHSFSALGGFVVSKTQYEGANVSIRGFTNSKLPVLDAGTVLNKPSEYYGACSNVSFLARATYNYDGRYLATVNFRADGSSKFGINNRWGYFPSFSLGWRISGESFLQDVKWLSDLKLRAGWGVVGNDQVGNYSSYGIYGIGANYNVDGVILPGYWQGQIGNDKLRWEKTAQTNIGIDFTALNSRIALTVDAYYKRTSDLLLMVNLPQSTGFDSGMQNIGVVTNKGFEFQLITRNIDRAFRWTTDLNFSINRNKVVDMAGTPNIYTGGLDKKISGNTSIIREGEALGTFYGYQAAGVNPSNGRMMYEKANGMLAYEGELNEATDRRVIGCAQPKLLYGMNNTFSWKGVDLSLFFQGSYGNDVFNAVRMFTEGMFDSRNQSTTVLQRWRNPGDYTSVPKAEKDKYPLISSRFVEDGSFLKLKNVKLAYTLPQKLTRKALMERVTVYASAENLVTFTNYSGYDPEVNIGGGSSSAMGIDQGVFPHATTVVFGATIIF